MVSRHTLENCRLLVVEDENVVAADLSAELARLGAVVLGPVGGVEDALALIASGTVIHGAILDINLRGQMVYPVADMLASRAIPFIFATGYDDIAIPPRFADAPRCEKPVSIAEIREAVLAAIHPLGAWCMRM